ncbi:MAG: NADP-dependent oxidoreductase [Nitrospiraceae bacterium]|nr:NADP-dependent oxidoreductase [Nitrospiraceae bacterium]
MPRSAGSGGAATAKEKMKPSPDIYTSMKAAAIDRFGPPEVLTLHTLPVQKPGPNEVLIALHSAGVGVWDAKIRDGSWASGSTKFPLVPGADGAGFIADKGALVRRFQIGDRVWATRYENPKGGFYSEYVTVDASNVALAPKQLALPEAAAAVVTGLTALQGIDDALHVQKGETVMIFGATGAVGSLAVQFAKLRGARVIGTASGSDASAFVRKLGADEVFDARSDDAVEQLRVLAPDGLDAVLALAGSGTLDPCLELVRAGGRIAYPNGVEPEPGKRRGITVQAYNGEAGTGEFERLDRAVAQAGLKVPIAATYPLEQAAKAHERIERGHVMGRIVLQIRP